MAESVPLSWQSVEAVPLIHGRLAFAMAVRERLLGRRWAAVAVELPPSLRRAVEEGLDLLPVIHAVVYHEWRPDLELEPDPDAWQETTDGEAGGDEAEQAWYVPLDPCDGIIEALRVARGERVSVHFVDAEVEGFVGRELVLPDPHALHTLGLDRYYQVVLPQLEVIHPPTAEDRVRERHMAARLRALVAQVGDRGPILFLCGMAHWQRIRDDLERGRDSLHREEGPSPEAIEVLPVRHESLFHVLGEAPLATWHWMRYRDGFALESYRPTNAVVKTVATAAAVFEEQHRESLERPTPAALATTLEFTRKLTVHGGRLLPDLYTLAVAAKGVVGNDFALALLEAARTYPPNRVVQERAFGETAEPTLEERLGLEVRHDEAEDGVRDPGAPPRWLVDLLQEGEEFEPLRRAPLETTGTEGRIGDELARMVSRTPGVARELRRLKLQTRPPEIDQRLWRTAWNPLTNCSWPPEDVVIENFRSYVSSRTLSLAGIDRIKVEEFTASLKDGLAIRETLRDLPRGKIHVKEEPRVPGRVGAVVVIFEEDDAGTRYPWRLTWMAEHENESTLAFYATSFLDDMIGPGIGRARYGGCMMVFPPKLIPDVWDDLRFEKARRPSERLLLAALWHCDDRFVAHLSDRPPAPELRQTAARLGKHLVHLPLSSFSAATLGKLRRFHVLNGHVVRSWAAHFIR